MKSSMTVPTVTNWMIDASNLDWFPWCGLWSCQPDHRVCGGHRCIWRTFSLYRVPFWFLFSTRSRNYEVAMLIRVNAIRSSTYKDSDFNSSDLTAAVACVLSWRQIKGGESSTYLMMPIVSTLERGEFTVKLKAFSSQREDYEEIPIKIDVSHSRK